MKKLLTLPVLTTLLLVGVQLSAKPIPPANSFSLLDCAQQQKDPQPPMDADKAMVFTGKVIKTKGQFVLMDLAAKATYALDDQEKAKTFEGKTVQVTGTLETASNTIHILNIKPVA